MVLPMPRAEAQDLIAVWPATAPAQPDPSTHLWYRAPDGRVRRICNDLRWPDEQPLVSDGGRPYVPCSDCQGLLIEDIAQGERRLDPTPDVWSPFTNVRYPLKIRRYPQEREGYHVPKLPLDSVPLTVFAHFCEASGTQKVRIVREARLYQTNASGYAGRDHYLELRNLLDETHWATGDIALFEAALPKLVKSLKDAKKADNYQTVGTKYIAYWRRRNPEFFTVRPDSVVLQGLSIRIAPEVGLRDNGDQFALKLSFSAPKPTRMFRSVVQHLSAQALPRPQRPMIWDVRRELVLDEVQISPGFDMVMDAEALGFRHIWESLDVVISPNAR